MTEATLPQRLKDHAVSVVVPVYNEALVLRETLPELVELCRERDWQLIVVNDGSTDGSREILVEHERSDSLTLVHHKVNRGYGGALKAGIRAATCEFVGTIDADGQHRLEDLNALYDVCRERGADMVVGGRGTQGSSRFRETGKWLIRRIIRILLPIEIHDVNSGLKIYRTEFAQKYAPICPDSMAFSDVITLTFISERRLVLEHPITIKPRLAGTSTIGIPTAIDTVLEILNIITLFNPMRIFFPLAIGGWMAGLLWGLPFILLGRGVSVAAMLAVSTGTVCFFLGLIAEQLAAIRKATFDE